MCLVDKDSRGGAGAAPPGPLRIARAILALPGLVLGVVPLVIVALAYGWLFKNALQHSPHAVVLTPQAVPPVPPPALPPTPPG